MTEEAGERRAAFPQLRGIVPDAVLEWPHLRVVAWSAFFFLVALAVLWVSRIDLVHFPDGSLKPESTPYINHESQANSFLHGHLDLTKELSGFITEPALYNGKEFCIPPPDKAPGVGSGITLTPDPNCKMYLQHSPGPALMLLPGVAIFGLEMNQTLVSIVLAAMTAPLVFLVVRKLVENEATQVWLTVLFLFGTIFWFTAANGGVWYFSHTAALLFLFAALYTTFVRRNAFLTGALVGAAFLCRPSVAMSAPFFLIMFSDEWLHWSKDRPLLQRIDLRPLLFLAAGAGIFVTFDFVFNYLRFDNPLESGYSYSEQVHQAQYKDDLYKHGTFYISYIPRHIPVAIEGMPIFSTMGSYIWPSHFGQAIWATTPAFFFSLFAGLRNRRLIIGGAVLLAISALVMIFRSAGAGWGLDGVDNNFLRPPAVFDWIPEHLNPIASWHLLPFWALIAIAVAGGAITAWRSGFKDRLVIACWAAIIPIALNNFLFAATGWAQFGYRYGLDFYPFLFLLVVKAVGNQLRWYHMALIVVSIVINLWGVLWIYQFDPAHLNDWTWVSF